MGALTRVEDDDPNENDWVVSVWNEALGIKSGRLVFDVLSSMMFLGRIQSRLRTEGGSGYI
jgi:hypothetical protein